MKWQDDGGRGDLTDRQWQKLQPLLPPQKAHTGQPAYDHRRILNGILWLERTAVRLGEIFQNAMVTIAQSPVDSIGGGLQVYGRKFGQA
jgi:transposase